MRDGGKRGGKISNLCRLNKNEKYDIMVNSFVLTQKTNTLAILELLYGTSY